MILETTIRLEAGYCPPFLRTLPATHCRPIDRTESAQHTNAGGSPPLNTMTFRKLKLFVFPIRLPIDFNWYVANCVRQIGSTARPFPVGRMFAQTRSYWVQVKII